MEDLKTIQISTFNSIASVFFAGICLTNKTTLFSLILWIRNEAIVSDEVTRVVCSSVNIVNIVNNIII